MVGTVGEGIAVGVGEDILQAALLIVDAEGHGLACQGVLLGLGVGISVYREGEVAEGH